MKTLRDALLATTVQESDIRCSLALDVDETHEKKAPQTRDSLIGYIRVLEDDFLEAAQDTYNLTVSQLRIKNPMMVLVTEGTGPHHQVVDGQVVSPHLEEGNGVEDPPSLDLQMV